MTEPLSSRQKANNIQKKKLSFSLLLLFAPVSVIAAVKNNTELYDMSIKELLNVRVTAVSRTPETVIAAPGVVTVMTEQQIRESGARNVHEALMNVPGISYSENYFALSGHFSIRGNLNPGGNNKTLLLIDGHPFYHVTDGINFSDMIALQAIKRIEVIRGPVSVMYGTNAFSGVINIVMKKELAKSDYEFDVSAASFGTKQLGLNLAKHWDTGQLFLSGRFQKQDGYTQQIDATQDFILNAAGETQQFDEHKNLYLHIKEGEVEANLISFRQDKTAKYGILPTLLFQNIGPFEIEIDGINLRHQFNLSDSTDLHSMIRYDSTSYFYQVDNYQILQNEPDSDRRIGTGIWDGSKTGIEIYTQSQIDNWQLVNGFAWEKYRGDPVIFTTGVSDPFVLIPESSKRGDLSVYSNGSVQLNDDHKVIAGIRYTDNKNSGSHLDYRLGWVWSFSKNTTLKTLYGTANRAPQFDEQNQSAPPVIQGNKNLDFEVLAGFDIAVNYQSKNWVLDFGYFSNQSDKEIQTIPDINDIPTYQNIEGKNSSGIEFDWTYYYSTKFKIYFRGSHLINLKDRETGSNIKDQTIEDIFAAGISYHVSDPLKLNVSYISNSDWQQSDSYQLVNAGLHYNFDLADKNAELYLQVNNAFDEEYTYAEWQGTPVETIPGGPPRAWELGFRMAW